MCVKFFLCPRFAIHSPSEVDFIEIHAAHGYLLHSFVSPLSNTRDDIYGGQPLENRLRVISTLVQEVRKVWSGPLFVRISATDWAEGSEKSTDGKWLQWGIEQSKILVARLQEFGVDLVDCSSGGNLAAEVIPPQPGYQAGGHGTLSCSVMMR